MIKDYIINGGLRSSVEVVPDPLSVVGDPGVDAGHPCSTHPAPSRDHPNQLPGGERILPSQERSPTVSSAAVFTFLAPSTQELVSPAQGFTIKLNEQDLLEILSEIDSALVLPALDAVRVSHGRQDNFLLDISGGRPHPGGEPRTCHLQSPALQITERKSNQSRVSGWISANESAGSCLSSPSRGL